MNQRFDFISCTQLLYEASHIEAIEGFLQTLLKNGLSFLNTDITAEEADAYLNRRRPVCTELLLYYLLPQHYEQLMEDVQAILSTLPNPYKTADLLHQLLQKDDTISTAKKEELDCYLRNPHSYFSQCLIYAMLRRQDTDRYEVHEKADAGFQIQSPSHTCQDIAAYEKLNDSQKDILQNMLLLSGGKNAVSKQLFQYLGGMFLSNSADSLLQDGWLIDTDESHRFMGMPTEVYTFLFDTYKPKLSQREYFLIHLEKLCRQYGNDLCFADALSDMMETLLHQIEFDNADIAIPFLDTALSYLLNCNRVTGAKHACSLYKDLTLSVGDSIAAASYYSYQGQIYYREEKFQKAQDSFQKGIDLLTPPTKEGAALLSSLYGNLSNIHRILKEEDTAKEMLDKSMSVNQEFQLLEAGDSYAGKVQYAKTLAQAGQYQEAKKELLSCLRQAKKELGSENTTIAYLYHTLGSLELEMNAYDDARFHIKKAQELFAKYYKEGDSLDESLLAPPQ